MTLLGLGIVFAGTDVMATQLTSNSGNIEISEPWARASIGTKGTAAVYMTIHNAGKKDVDLVRLSTKRAKMAQLHQSQTEASGISMMSAMRALKIPAGETVKLEPKGMHVMLMQLKAAMEEGDSFDLLLTFSNGDQATVTVPTLAIGASGPDS